MLQPLRVPVLHGSASETRNPHSPNASNAEAFDAMNAQYIAASSLHRMSDENSSAHDVHRKE